MSICIYYCQKEKGRYYTYLFIRFITDHKNKEYNDDIDIPDKLNTRMCVPTNYAICNMGYVHGPVLLRVLPVLTDHKNNYPAYKLDTASFVRPFDPFPSWNPILFSAAAVGVYSLIFYLTTNSNKYA